MAVNSRQQPVFIWAHRGASAMAPENTMVAFRLAEAAGADGIELDIHLNRDGLPVVLHDETLDRTTSGTGPVSAINTANLLGLDAGGWFAADYLGEQVPLLADVLTWAGDRVRLNIEIKSAKAGQAVLATLRDFPGARVLVSSFNHKLLFHLRRTDARLPIGFLIDSRFWRLAARRAVACAAESFHPPANHVSRTMVTWCHRHNLTVYPWTVDAPGKKKALLRLGVDGFFTNTP